jgi:hypothetical protein
MPPPQQIRPPSAQPMTGAPPMRKPSVSGGSANHASPPASASTPANAPTPVNAASPHTPKSPRTKAPPKPKAAGPAPKRKLSKAGNTPAGEPSTPAAAPSPTTGTKRPREEDSAPTPVPPTPDAALAPTPAPVKDEPSPPKRVKTEWEGPPSEELERKRKEVEEIQTDEDATRFMETMSEFLRTAGEGPEGASLTSNMAAEFSTLLKSVSAPLDMPEASSSTMGLLDVKREPSPRPIGDEPDFTQFFDFSSFGEDHTPELVSSPNPSPESGSDSDPHHLASGEVKVEDSSDPLHLGGMKELDGGEAAYYTSPDWRWEGSMPHLDQPWAIFPSA